MSTPELEVRVNRECVSIRVGPRAFGLPHALAAKLHEQLGVVLPLLRPDEVDSPSDEAKEATP